MKFIPCLFTVSVVLGVSSQPASAATALSNVALGKLAAEHPGQIEQKYKGVESFTITGEVYLITDYFASSIGRMSKAVVMRGAPGVAHGAGSMIQLNPVDDNESLVSKVGDAKKIRAECTTIEEVIPGYPMLRGCRFKPQ